MVQLMSSRKPPVKLELEESLEDQLGPLHKRCKIDSSLQTMAPGSSICDPLDEPSPLGLRLKKSPSFLDLIQMKLSQGNNSRKNSKVTCGNSSVTAADKLKASNFPASLLKIGNWEYKSRYEGDLVGKCYFAKHKLVWEVLDGGLKNKIEIQWSDIVAIKANFPDDGPETLDVVLARQPLFFRETNPQPRKHTLWQATSDFTGGEASKHRHHFLQCKQGFMGKHFEKLIQCDPRLNFLSRQPEISMEPSCFEPRTNHYGALNDSSEVSLSKVDDRTTFFALREATSPSGVLPSSTNTNEHHLFAGRTHESISQEAPSSSSDTYGFEEIRSLKAEGRIMPSHWDQLKVPGIQPSMSMSDLVNHIGQRISEQMNPGNTDSDLKNHEILEEITQYLLSDSQLTLASDEQSLMSRVNSLYSLLEKDPGSVRNLRAMSTIDLEGDGNDGMGEPKFSIAADGCQSSEKADDVSNLNQARPMSRMDSAGELLLNLPRIASLPQFL